MDCLKPPEALDGNADSSKSPETLNGYVDSTKSSTSDGNTADLEDDSQKVPNPRAYMCIKKFLKELLLAEVKLNTHPLIKQLEEADLAEELREQLLAYVRREYLCKQCLNHNQGARLVLDWWIDLSEHRHARTLAMLAIKIYSIAVNSMAEERIVSNFTRFNSKLHSQQEVKTLVDMIQVWQWYLYKDYPQMAPKTHPTVHWLDMDKTIFDCHDNRIQNTAPEDDIDDFFVKWPWEAGPSSGMGPSDKDREGPLSMDSFELNELVNLQSSSLRSMLCDKLRRKRTLKMSCL
ncbi:hypothetical protein BN946_scf184921.g1 [Trametes cinnabarina]|uniref:Uncharacterized protein n=1 Tax=Pycnoporus cinnabarinus TaxID=5643 RepID=A0A060SMV5_PYCCI|nr:hypothetical protein BN946_scf184921.g1 [Trametes cinnabarina]